MLIRLLAWTLTRLRFEVKAGKLRRRPKVPQGYTTFTTTIGQSGPEYIVTHESGRNGAKRVRRVLVGYEDDGRPRYELRQVLGEARARAKAKAKR